MNKKADTPNTQEILLAQPQPSLKFVNVELISNVPQATEEALTQAPHFVGKTGCSWSNECLWLFEYLHVFFSECHCVNSSEFKERNEKDPCVWTRRICRSRRERLSMDTPEYRTLGLFTKGIQCIFLSMSCWSKSCFQGKHFCFQKIHCPSQWSQSFVQISQLVVHRNVYLVSKEKGENKRNLLMKLATVSMSE